MNVFFEYWPKELNFFEFDAKNWWSFSLKFWQQRIELSFQKWLNELNMTQRIEPFFSMWLKELNFLFVSKCDSKNWTFELFYKYGFTLRIQPFLNLFIWLNELDLFYMTQRIEPFWIITQRIESSFWRDSMNWIFFVIQRIVLSLLNVIQRIESFLLNVTQRIESLLKNMKNWSFLQIWLRIEPFLNLSYDSKKWTFNDMTQRIKPFCMWLKELKFSNMTLTELNISFLEYDAQNWTSLFSNMTHRIEHLFSRIWRTELNISFLEYDAQNWTSHLFSNMTHRIFLNMTHRFLFNMTHRTEHLFLQKTHRTEHLFLQMTQRIDFFKSDSKNWTSFLKI